MKKEVTIGLFTILMILAAWFGIRFLKGIDIFSSDNYYYARYERTDGIQQSAAILVRGVKIGNVSEIVLDPTYDGGVTLKLSISKEYNIPQDSKAEIYSTGLMGSKAINITWGSSDKFIETNGTIETSISNDIMDIATTQLNGLTGQLEQVTTGLSTTLASVNGLVEGNAMHISGIIRNLDTLTLSLNRVVESNEANLSSTLTEFSSIFSENSGQIDSIILNINTLSAELKDANLGSSLSTSLNEISALLNKINKQEGSLGKIVADEKLYDNLASAGAGLDALFVDIKENPNRYVHISLFGRDDDKAQAKEAKKLAKEAKKRAKKSE